MKVVSIEIVTALLDSELIEARLLVELSELVKDEHLLKIATGHFNSLQRRIDILKECSFESDTLYFPQGEIA